MNKVVVTLTVVFGGICLAIGLLLYYWVAPTIKESVKVLNSNMSKVYVEKTKVYKDQFLLDEKYIMKTGIFRPDFERSGENAAAFLNPELVKLEKKESSFLDLTVEIRNQLVIQSDQWMNANLGKLSGSINSDWLKKLSEYQVWSDEPYGNISAVLEKDPLYNFFDKKIEPNYLIFYHWAQVRWLQSIFHQKTSPQQELRHFVRLLHSQGNLSATLMAVKILSLETDVSDFHPELVKEKALDQSELARIVRFSYAVSSILRTAMFAQEHYELFQVIQFGKCMAVEGSMPHFMMLYKPIFHHAWTDFYARMTDIVNQEKCGRTRYKKVWGNDEFTIKHMKGKDLANQVQKHFSINDKSKNYAFQSVPDQVNGNDIFEVSQYHLIARIFSTSLLSVSSPNPWEEYEKF